MKEVKLQQVAPADIERRSMEIIASEMKPHTFSAEELAIVKRCIHTSADFAYQDSLRFTDSAIQTGVDAIKGGCTIVTDTNMGLSGVNRRVLEKFGGSVRCFMAEPAVAEEAKARGVTRAVVSMEQAAKLEGTIIFAIGNAPTALVRVCQLMDEGKVNPALIIGAPVGFVNVEESKELLCSCETAQSIIPMGRKGGSNIAATICNALIYIASNDARE